MKEKEGKVVHINKNELATRENMVTLPNEHLSAGAVKIYNRKHEQLEDVVEPKCPELLDGARRR